MVQSKILGVTEHQGWAQNSQGARYFEGVLSCGARCHLKMKALVLVHVSPG